MPTKQQAPATKSPKNKPTATTLCVATRKGAWIFRSDAARRSWKVDGPHFFGHEVHHMVADPRAPRTVLAGVKTGHLGPTLMRSTDGGRRWKEATRPPAFAKLPPGATVDAAGAKPRAVDQNFWLTPGAASTPGVWYLGTSPQGLFRSDDDGDTWAPLPAVNDSAQFRAWMGTPQDGTPDGPKLHSIIVDPRDPQHLYFGMSGGGMHESRDGGQSWRLLGQGLEVVEGFDAADPTFHDPHCVRLCPTDPDRLYQQNHCGIYRLDRPGDTWVRIGRSMPKRIGDIGFPMVVHPRDRDVAWVCPMDGGTVWPRTAVQGKPAVYVTRDGGRRWERLDAGLPTAQAWWTVKRQAMTADAQPKVALYLGTTSGELWMGANEGARWRCIARHLPQIHAVEAFTA